MGWYFQKHDGYADVDQSSAAEPFTSGSIKDLPTALAREGVQNALDAKEDDSPGAVRIRILLGCCSGQVDQLNDRWFGDLYDHMDVEDSGAPESPDREEPCNYLVFEDFNTRGLTGDFRAQYEPGQKNDFVNFMYHDGISGKGNRSLGSRGVGKIVFTLASRARTIFALTVPQGGQTPLLVGKNLLRYRKVGEQRYYPRSYFLKNWEPEQPREPVDDPDLIERFREDFGVQRHKEPGLSIVVPFLDPSVTSDRLHKALVEEYSFAILSNALEFEIKKGENDSRRVNEKTFAEINFDEDTAAAVALQRWAVETAEPELQTRAPDPCGIQEMTEDLVDEEIRERIRHALDSGSRVSIRVPLHIRPREGPAVKTFADVFMEGGQTKARKPTFIRELLPVSDVRDARPVPQVRSLVLIRSGELADFLRASEGANHTDWSPRTEKFKEKYIGRRGEIAFVARCVNRLVEIARGDASEPVGGISTHFFSVPSVADPGPQKEKKKKEKGKEHEEPQPPSPGPPQPWRIAERHGGFEIVGRDGVDPPARISLRLAYDVLRGSPWSQYEELDFDLRDESGPVKIEAVNADISRDRGKGNRLVIKPESRSFKVALTGFDPNRDLITEARSG